MSTTLNVPAVRARQAARRVVHRLHGAIDLRTTLRSSIVYLAPLFAALLIDHYFLIRL